MKTNKWTPIYLIALKKKSKDGSIQYLHIGEGPHGSFLNRADAAQALEMSFASGKYKHNELYILKLHLQINKPKEDT